ncbi:MAG: FAD-dependent oxidoreductase [Kiritimatiellae bacterium]|nr:FAD-dependent oxidoreductase [Kiritimatiellia bacterium]
MNENRLKALSDQSFDVLVIGGGIHGATAAWALARQGCSVALVEQGDYGWAASANSQKIIHGGLRYLQQLDIPRMRASISARRMSLTHLPHLTHPARFLVPTSGFFMRSKAALLAAMTANDFISFDRNFGVDPSRHLPYGSLKGRDFLHQVAEGLVPLGTGAGVWHDGFAENTERFTLAFLLSAQRLGAVTRNYARASRLMLDGARIVGAEVRDELTGEQAEVRARVTINATGGWLDALLPGCFGSMKRNWPWTRAYNIIVRRRFFGSYGVGLESIAEYVDADAVLKRGKRNYFFAPWREGTIIGTMYASYRGDPGKCGLTAEEIQAYLDEINTIYPPAELALCDVTFAHAGILPARPSRVVPNPSDPAKDTELLDYRRLAGLDGMLLIKGVKYTTGIQVAEKVARYVMQMLGGKYQRGKNPPVVGGEELVTPGWVDARLEGLTFDDRVLAYHAQQYGTQAHEVLGLCSENPDWAERLNKDDAVLGANVIYAVRHEQACHLTDVVFRRTGLGSFRYPGDEAVASAASLMAAELEWDTKRTAEEIRGVEEEYRRLGVEHVLS